MNLVGIVLKIRGPHARFSINVVHLIPDIARRANGQSLLFASDRTVMTGCQTTFKGWRMVGAGEFARFRSRPSRQLHDLRPTPRVHQAIDRGYSTGKLFRVVSMGDVYMGLW